MLGKRLISGLIGAVAAIALAAGVPAKAADQKPVTIGFGMALTGGLAPVGKSALLAMQIWEHDVNEHGGLLGRPVKLVYYDDQSNPANVPGIYTKLLDIDHVDLVVSGYATNMIAPAMPIIMQHNRTFISLFGLDVNSEFHYPRYFSFLPAGGPHPKQSFSAGFFAVAMAQHPKPKTVAIVGADAEFAHNAMDGALALAKEDGLKVVYDRTYPPTTADYTPIVRAIQATNPDLVFVSSYPPDTAGMVRAAHEVGLKTKLFGGGMVGLQVSALKTQLGPMLNGIVDYDFWLPWSKEASPESMAFLKAYQAKAGAAGVDPLGYYLPPFAYSYMQVLQQAVEGTKSLDQGKLADYLKSHTFKTVVGDVKFGPDGEWTQPRVLEVQFRGITGNDLAQFKDPKTEVILWPSALKTGTVEYPYTSVSK
ncbi:MAG TPA: amino acid ABC transporter substrate-binding protein [Acetobacteraceae bacterium]|nr:amino acid ABC transporter substrate-binding protein [Acetobacteraceae bacterium]